MKKYGGSLLVWGIGLVLLAASVIYQWNTAGSSVEEYIRIFSNAALVPGVLLTGVGLMAKISDAGFFDGIRYSAGSILAHLRREEKRYASYYDYVRRERKRNKGNPLLMSGIIFLAAAVVLTGAYYLV